MSLGTLWLDEWWLLSRLAVPLFCQYVVDQISLMVEMSFIGNLQDPVQLLSLVLGSSVGLAFGYVIISGIVSAFETLSAQAAGAGDFPAVYNALRIALCACLLTCVPITFVWMASARLLVLLGQDAEVAAAAGMLLRMTLPVLYLHAVQDCLDKHLLSQGIVMPSAVIALIQAFCAPFWSWVFVRHLSLGLRGAAYASCICMKAWQVLQVYTARIGCGLACPVWLGPAFHSIILHGAVGNTGGPLSAAELAEERPEGRSQLLSMLYHAMNDYLQVLIFMSGLLANGKVAVAATGLCNQLSALVWMVACAIGAAATTRVGNQLGAGNGFAARQASGVALSSTLLTQAGLGTLALLFARPLIHLMTKDQQVLELAVQSMPALAVCFVADGQNVVAGSILKGMGRQVWGMWLTLTGWWMFGVPLAWLLAFTMQRNVAGLWGGFATAAAVQAAVQCYVLLWLVHWGKEQERAANLISSLRHRDIIGPTPMVQRLQEMEAFVQPNATNFVSPLYVMHHRSKDRVGTRQH